jgi:hypothetical protein
MTRLFQIVVVLTLFLATTANLGAQSSSPVRVRGTVLSIQGDLAVKSRTGEDVRIRLADGWSDGGVVPAKLSDIKSGTFVGIASTPQPGGPSRAIEVLIFPEGMRGTGEGHYPWDLQPESTITNATSDVQSVDRRALTLSYKAGEQKIVVGPETRL